MENNLKKMKRFGIGAFLGLTSLTVMRMLLLLPANAQEEPNFKFIAIGDTPYSAEENELIKGSLRTAIDQADTPFLVHYGDFQGSSESCSEDLVKERRDDIYNLFPSGPIFYTPGDNEWVDCDRAFLDSRVPELTMLDIVRKAFFSEPIDVPDKWAYASQPNFPENARWIYNNVLFATVHLTATNNGRQEILLDDVEAALALVDARDQANRVWLGEAFSTALETKASAVVIITQADVTEPWGGGACTAYSRIYCDAFASFRETLIRDARGFFDFDEPRRPVLLLHGDTNPYCWDKDFGGELAPNLWRINAWGDYRTPGDATEIIIQLDNPQEPFAAKTLMQQLEPDAACN